MAFHPGGRKAGVKGPSGPRDIRKKGDPMKTAEQIAARKAKSKARREAKKAFIPVNDENLNTLKTNFKALVAKYQAGTLSIKEAGSLWKVSTRIPSTLTKEELEAKIAKQQARLARLEAALRG